MIREILERYINNKNTRKEWEMASRGMLPLTPNLMKEFEEPVKLAYHVTTLKGLNTIKKLQGQKKQIAAFTKGAEGISRGAMDSADYLVTLSGTSSLTVDGDMGSALSRDGYRWLFPQYRDGGFTDIMRYKIMQKYSLGDYMEIGPYIRDDLDGKGKGQFVSWYFDEMKKMIDKKLIEELKDYFGENRTDYWSNNELILYNIKVKDVKVIYHYEGNETYEDIETQGEILSKKIKKLGFKYGGLIHRNDVAKIGR